MNKTWLAIIVASGILAVIYISMLFPASRGYGYMGYYGYHRSPSFFYMGGPRVFHERPSVREGSLGGPGQTGRGLTPGK